MDVLFNVIMWAFKAFLVLLALYIILVFVSLFAVIGWLVA